MPEGRASDVILIPVHNRRETTLRALEWLEVDGVASWSVILVVDDGSTDGTAESIARNHAHIKLLRGDGTWWWGGAIRRGMEWALQRGAERVFWLNDDCHPPPGALRALREFCREGREAAWIDALTPGGWSYGAHRKSLWRVRRCTPDEEVRGEVDTFSGNCVCLTRGAVERVGLPHDHLFPHGLGDLDYGLRLRAAGARMQRLPAVIAMNADPSPESSESWWASARPMREIWRGFSSPRSFLYFPSWRRFVLRHWGPAWGWAVFSAPYLRWCAIAAARPLRRAFSSSSGRATSQG
jgi:GT2 family glycosyltransferase